MTYKNIFVRVRLTGTRDEIDSVIAFIKDAGAVWADSGKYIQQRGQPWKFAYYLNDLRLPQLGVAVPPAPGEPQPRPWDAVLGGQGE